MMNNLRVVVAFVYSVVVQFQYRDGMFSEFSSGKHEEHKQLPQTLRHRKYGKHLQSEFGLWLFSQISRFSLPILMPYN
jgi:hypothetical protein